MEVVKWNLSLLIEMAQKIKKMLMRAQLNKMKVKNVRRVKEMEAVKREKKGGGRKGKIDVEKKTKKKMRRGIRALTEIKKYQTMTELLIQCLPFQRLVHEIV